MKVLFRRYPVDSGSEEDEDTEQKVEDVVPEVVAGSAVETPEIAEKIDSPVEPEPVEEAVVPVETVASEEVNEERVEVIKTAGPAESSAMKYFIAIVALVVLLCAGTVAYCIILIGLTDYRLNHLWRKPLTMKLAMRQVIRS